MPRKDRKTRGRTSITGSNLDTAGVSPTRPGTRAKLRADTTRPVGPGGTVHRGDRRDTNPVYTTTVKHAARGNTPRKNVATRKD